MSLLVHEQLDGGTAWWYSDSGKPLFSFLHKLCCLILIAACFDVSLLLESWMTFIWSICCLSYRMLCSNRSKILSTLRQCIWNISLNHCICKFTQSHTPNTHAPFIECAWKYVSVLSCIAKAVKLCLRMTYKASGNSSCLFLDA